MEENTKIGSYLRQKRIEKGISQEDLALKCGIARHTLHFIELNKQYPSKETLKLICSTLDLNFETSLDILHYDKAQVYVPYNIKFARICTGLTRRQFSELCGISITTLTSIEENCCEPQLSKLKAIAKGFRASNYYDENQFGLYNYKNEIVTFESFSNEDKLLLLHFYYRIDKLQENHKYIISLILDTSNANSRVKNIKKIRLLLGVTQVNLASYCDIYQNFLSNIENGKVNPSPKILDKIYNVFSVLMKSSDCSDRIEIEYSNSFVTLHNLSEWDKCLFLKFYGNILSLSEKDKAFIASIL